MKFEIGGKQIEVFYNETDYKKVPVIILNSYGEEGKSVWEECQKLGTKDFILVAISKLNWSDDMTPWECPPLFKGDSHCKGLANQHLELIENSIIPEVKGFIKKELNKEIDYFGIAGYSLGGLFALYVGYKTDIFKKIASASGSMWYPNIAEYIKTNKISENIEKIYFSLGNKEKNSKNETLKTVEDKTKDIYDFLSNNINTIYEENEGNHFQDANFRMAKGIKWILE